MQEQNIGFMIFSQKLFPMHRRPNINILHTIFSQGLFKQCTLATIPYHYKIGLTF